MTYVPTRALSAGVTDQRSCPETNSHKSVPTDSLQLLEGMPFVGEDFRERGMSAAQRNLLGAGKYLAISAGIAVATSERIGLTPKLAKPLRVVSVGYAVLGAVDILGEARQFAKDLSADLEGLLRESEDDWYS